MGSPSATRWSCPQEQVDDGSYEVVDDDTFVIGDNAVFDYQIDGDSLMLEPVIPDDCSTKACHGNAVYWISVAFPGQTWQRIA